MVIDVVMHVVMERVIAKTGCGESKKKPRLWFNTLARAGVGLVDSLEQSEFGCAADGGLPIVHAELAVNVFGVGAQGIQRNHQVAGQFRATQVSAEQPQHVKFTFAQGLDKILDL